MKFLLFFACAGAILASASTGGGQSPALAEKAQHAKELMAAGRAGEAVPIYTELVKSIPNNPGLILNLGLALDLSGRKRDAIRQYEAVLKIDANSFPALLLAGTAYMDLGEPPKALAPLEKAVKLQPGNFDAQAMLAEAELGLDRFAEAVRSFQELSAEDPSNAKMWYGLGSSYEGLAQQSFDQLATVAPGSAYWLDLVAESRLETKQDYSAFYFYHQALAKMASMRGVHAALADVYRDTGHPEWASVEVEKERQLPPPDCAAQRLECDFQAGNFVNIVQATERSSTPEAYYWRTRACNKLALDAYFRLGQLPASVETHELKAKIESKRRQYAEAAKEWRAALGLSPGNRHFQKELAIALYRSGDLQGAETLFQDLLQREPEATDLNFFLGDTILNSQKPAEAVAYLEKAVKNDPKLLPAQRSLGLAYMQIGRAGEAIPHLKNALSVDEDGSVHYQLGRAYQAQGERELARVMLEQYQEMHRAQEAENKAVERDVAITPPD
ncbi:MAG TPA: tetratricopeptide repeat protein [Terriglobia bacterium]|nr:tetratricopeptide repeat protein [Terriglobia bacterium]